MQKKVLLIGDSPISMSPYILSYIEVYEKHGIPYELAYWNKTLEDVTQTPNEFVPYNCAHDNSISGWRKVFKIYGFARFVKQRMKNNEYAYVVIFTIAHSVFLYPLLKRKYRGRYVFDIRDYSPLCRLSIVNSIIKKLIQHSAFTVLSSRGFLRWLPDVDSNKIVISHNTTISAIESELNFTIPVN